MNGMKRENEEDKEKSRNLKHGRKGTSEGNGKGGNRIKR